MLSDGGRSREQMDHETDMLQRRLAESEHVRAATQVSLMCVRVYMCVCWSAKSQLRVTETKLAKVYFSPCTCLAWRHMCVRACVLAAATEGI